MSGLTMQQTNDPSAPILRLSSYYNNDASMSLAALYGSNGTSISASVFVWATELLVSLEGPNATSAGVVHLGYFPLASLQGGGTLSVN